MQASSLPKRTKHILAVLGILILALAALYWSCRSGPTKEEVMELINRGLPIGSNIDQVKGFLDNHGIGHSDYNTSIPYGTFYNEVEDSKKEAIKGYMNASIKDTERGFLTTFGIYMQFYFDENDRLIAYTVKKVGTGP